MTALRQTLLLRRLPTLALALAVGTIVAFFCLAHEGLFETDDYIYARFAHELATGTYHMVPDPTHPIPDPLRERLLVFGPVAGLYRLLGVNIISTTLWPLLCTLACVGIIWGLYRRREPLVAALAILLQGLYYFGLNLSTYLLPDNIVMGWGLASAATLLVGRRTGQARPVVWGAAFAVFTFGALLSKETIVFYAPWYLAVLLYDLYGRRHGQFWGGALGMGTVVLGTYLLAYYWLTGDALYRYHTIELTNQVWNKTNFSSMSAATLRLRLTWGPPAFLAGIGLGLLVLPAAAAGRRGPDLAHPEARFWLGLAGSALLTFWLGSTSLHTYNPISLQVRMAMPLLPPLALAAAFGLRNGWRTGRGYGWMGAGLLLVAGWLHSGAAVPYAVLGSTLLGLRLLRARLPTHLGPGTAGQAVLLVLAVAVGLLPRPVYFMHKPSVSSHFAQVRVLRAGTPPTARGVLFVDGFLLMNYDFSYGFRVPAGLRVRQYWARDTVRLLPGEQAWLLLNRSTLRHPELTRNFIRYTPDSVLAYFSQRRLVAQDGEVTLYRLARWPGAGR